MIVDQILDYFQGREDTVAVGTGTGFCPLPAAGLTREHVAEHLAGTSCYGIYLVRSDNSVLCSCVDFDNKASDPDPQWKAKAEAVNAHLTQQGIPTLMELSQSGEAAHNWVFFSEPIPAAKVRTFWRQVGEELGIKLKEIYPRQDKVDEGKFGNLIRLPLWNKSQFVNSSWEKVEPETALTIAKIKPLDLPVKETVSPVESPKSTNGLSTRVQQLIAEPGLLSRRWSGDTDGLNDRSKSAIGFSIANLLVRRYVPTDEIKAAVRAWCAANGCDKGERQDWIDLTITKAYETIASGATIEQIEASPPSYERLTCADLDSGDFKLDYLIDRTLVARQPCILAGPRKALKTSLMIDMAIALATGGHFVGSLAVRRKARVAVMSGESGLGTLQETARRVAVASKVTLASIENLIWSTSLPKFGDTRHAQTLEKFLRDDRIEVLFIDPAYLAMPGGDPGNLFAQGELLSAMNQVCMQAGAGLVLVHHAKKGNKKNPNEPMELDDIAWSGFQEWSRQWVLINRREKYQSGTGTHRMWLSTGGSAGHSSVWALDVNEEKDDGLSPRIWDVAVRPAGEARKEAKERATEQKSADAQERILTVLEKYPLGETKSALGSLTGLSGTNVKMAISTLENAGKVRKCKVKKNNMEHPGYQLAA